jgi:hypothetical protein
LVLLIKQKNKASAANERYKSDKQIRGCHASFAITNGFEIVPIFTTSTPNINA